MNTLCRQSSFVLQQGKSYEDIKKELGEENAGVTTVKDVSIGELSVVIV